jgi:hypothetical protein
VKKTTSMAEVLVIPACSSGLYRCRTHHLTHTQWHNRLQSDNEIKEWLVQVPHTPPNTHTMHNRLLCPAIRFRSGLYRCRTHHLTHTHIVQSSSARQ